MRLVSVAKESQAPPENLWTPQEVSAFLGDLPIATLYQWRHKGIGPKSRRVGRHLRYKPEDVRTWFEEQE